MDIGIKNKELGMLRKISDILIKERDFDILFGEILDAAVELTNAEGATIYMVDEANKELKFIKVINSKMGVYLDSNSLDWPPIALYKDNRENWNNLAALCYHKKQSFNFPDVYDQNLFDSSGTKEYDKRNDYRTRSIVAVPMMDHKNNIIGIIQLINATSHHGEVIPFDSESIKNLELVSSISAIIMNNQKLVADLRRSFYQFIKSIAWGIDKKAKHFSGHIARVSELSNMLANGIAENNDKNIGYAETQFTDDELEEINVAGLMHDLGKIITPMHILDKSSKLEKIFDRLELVMSRIDHIETVISFKIEKSDNEDLSEELSRLKKYRDFISKINSGRNFLTDEQKAFLETIYHYKHKYKDKELFILTKDEFYNLAIRRGTLNKEDIEIIREHAYVTGKMLSQITFPKYLANAPQYAEQHHEKLNGKGYPKGLDADDIPLQSRIIALADVFEALTALRPYKDPLKLSNSFAILKKMVAANEIDGDLFNFALKSGILDAYAKKHLMKEQIDVNGGEYE